MNREQRRKENKKNKFNPTNTETNEMYRLLKISIVVIVIFALLFFGVSIFVTKEIDVNKNQESQETGNTDAILANSIFKQKEEEYYVYFYDFNNENTNIATTIINRIPDLIKAEPGFVPTSKMGELKYNI